MVDFRYAVFAQQAANDWPNKSVSLGLLDKYDETIQHFGRAASQPARYRPME